ncbi:AMP-binding protein [Rothia sp. AR01]|uniref:AMP-binding protein n=1 Tax=Rothia santali TaxID=2949643 RepID=A0A9X2HJ72_9MICC|nr:AMP-binding protein [Rothia santali]MCP3426706.1 AMP-binding protein [Rothia santali]
MTVTEEFRQARDQLLRLREDYGAARREFEWPRFEHFNFALDWFDAVAATPEGGARNALVIVERDGSSQRVTYREMAERSARLASWLRAIGVGRGDRILLMLDNQVELWETVLAAAKLGAVLLPTTTMLGPSGLTERVERGRVGWVVTNPVNSAKFAEVPGDFSVIETGTEAADRAADPAAEHPHHAYALSREASPDFRPDRPTRADETLLLYFTSGTTSQAKLVEHTHVSYPVGHLSTMYWIGLEPGDVHLNVASPGWAKHAWSNVFAPWIAEATVMIYNYARFDAGALMSTMDAEGVTSFCAPPTVWRMLIQANLSQLRNPPAKVVAAGEPLNPRVILRVQQAWGLDIRDGFGQTETTVQIANTPGQPVKVGSVGRPLPGYDVELLHEDTGEVIEGAGEGEVCLVTDPRPVGLMPGYSDDPAKNDAVFRDGLYRTGDVMSRDENGLYTYVGRSDDVFKASDYKISPFELESVLIEHPAVAEAAVVPSPDPIRLAVPKAYVALRADAEPTAETAESILAHCREKLPPYARVRRLEFWELPKTVSGKIRRVELRAREEVLRPGDHAAGDLDGRGPGTHVDAGAAAGDTASRIDGSAGREYADTDFPRLRG